MLLQNVISQRDWIGTWYVLRASIVNFCLEIDFVLVRKS